MAITITNLSPDLTMPLTEAIDAQTNFMESNAACQGAGISSIYNTVLCGSTSPESLQPSSPVCCRSETLDDTPAAGDTTVRETCSDGSITDVVTYADGQTCTFNRQSADPVNNVVDCDENGNEVLVGVTTSCKARNLGEPYKRYFIPVVSDFGNQVYCVDNSTYAFAWTGVGNAELVQFLIDYAADIDLEDPSNQYVAIVDGQPYVCGQDGAGTQVNATQWVAGQDDTGVDYYCYPGLSAFAHTTQDPLNLTPTNQAFDTNGDAITCPGYILDSLQASQQIKLGAFSPILSICPEWTGTPDPVDVPEPDDDGGLLNLLGVCDGVQVPELAGKTYQESYVMLWKDYWECEKKDKTLRNTLLAVQGATALVGLVTSIQTYNKILDKQLDVLCNVESDVALLAQCSATLLGTAETPGLLKECQANLLAGHNDRIGTINDRGRAFCEMADDEIDCYEQLWRPIVKQHAPHIASELHTMLHNGKLSSEYTTSWANGLQDCIKENMLPELKRQFAPLMSSVNCASQNLNDWRQTLKQKAFDLEDHFNRTYKEGEATMIPQVMDMSTCMVQRVCELRDWLYDLSKCDEATYKTGYQQGESAQAQAAMASAAQIIPKVVESVQWLEQNIPAATELFNCYKSGITKLNPQLFTNARDLAPEIQACFKWFKDRGDKDQNIYDKCYKDAECKLVTKQMDFAIKLVAQAEDSLARLDNWSVQDRVMYDDNFRNTEATKTVAIVDHGHDSSNELHAFGEWWDDRTKEFHKAYTDHWLPCDIDNLQKHCNMWQEVNPLQELHKNADQVYKTGTQALDIYGDSLIRADSYMKEVFADADRFDFCVEDPAVHHVRRRVEQALDELEKCTPQYSVGHLDDKRIALKLGGARAEGAAYASAQRWRWWANQQLDNTAHDRRLAMLSFMDSVSARGLAANAASTAAQSELLGHMREAITRGNIHTANMQDSGRSAVTIKGNEIDAMLRMIQLWHFWPELAASENAQFNSSVHQVHDQARNLAALGHFWPGQAQANKREAVNISQEAISTGVQLSQIGQYYLTQADAMNDARAAIGNQAGQLGAQFAGVGHNLHRMASDRATQTLQQSITAASPGIQAGQLGAQHMATALDVENKMTLNALEHVKAGISAMSLGVDFLGEVRDTQALAGSYGVNAAAQLLNLFETGRRQTVLGMEANAQCKQTEFEMLCKAKDFLMNNYRIVQNSLHAGTAGTLSAGNNLLAQQGNNVGGSFGLLGNSLEGLLTSNNAPPFPTGGPAFGLGGGGFY